MSLSMLESFKLHKFSFVQQVMPQGTHTYVSKLLIYMANVETRRALFFMEFL